MLFVHQVVETIGWGPLSLQQAADTLKKAGWQGSGLEGTTTQQ